MMVKYKLQKGNFGIDESLITAGEKCRYVANAWALMKNIILENPKVVFKKNYGQGLEQSG